MENNRGEIMATYKIQAPDGKIITLQGPEGATPDEIMQQAQRLYKSTASDEPLAPAYDRGVLKGVKPQDLARAQEKIDERAAFMNSMLFGLPQMLTPESVYNFKQAGEENPIAHYAGMLLPTAAAGRLGMKAGEMLVDKFAGPAIKRMGQPVMEGLTNWLARRGAQTTGAGLGIQAGVGTQAATREGAPYGVAASSLIEQHMPVPIKPIGQIVPALFGIGGNLLDQFRQNK
jgi:hypothetical protein